MSETNTQQAEVAQGTEPDNNDNSPQWGPSAPRGGKTVVARALKDGSRVPLFLGQTLINSLRDLGYNNTTSALCEHVDNALQWGATEVRVYFRQTGKQPNQRIDAMVYDNGKGMAPHVLKVAMAFGGSMVYENRAGIGRYGMGMKAAALNITRSVDVYSSMSRVPWPQLCVVIVKPCWLRKTGPRVKRSCFRAQGKALGGQCHPKGQEKVAGTVPVPVSRQRCQRDNERELGL